MKTYINPALIDAHNAQLQLEQLEGVKLKRLEVFEAYGRFLLICAAGVATLMVGFGLMMWLMTPPVAAQGDEYITTYEIAEVIVRQDDPEIFQTETSAGGLPSISESLSEIHSNITRTDRDKTERATTTDITSQSDTNTEVQALMSPLCLLTNSWFFDITYSRVGRVPFTLGSNTVPTILSGRFISIVIG